MSKDLVDDYLRWLAIEKGRSPRTLEAYRSDLNRFLAWCEQHSVDPASVREVDLERFIGELVVAGAAATSVTRATSVLRGFFGYAFDEGLMSHDPATSIRIGRRGRSLPHPIPEGVLIPFLDSLSGDEPLDRRDRALAEFLYGTGARVSEVVVLRLSDVDFTDDTIRLFGKGSKQRIVPMGRVVHETLADYLQLARPRLVSPASDTAVFLNARGGRLSRQGIDLILRRRGVAAGVPTNYLHAHAFRHSCATHMLAHGADIRSVQELLGHASISTTQVYTAVAGEALHTAYRAAHPRASGM